jgi:hypothetical protein
MPLEELALGVVVLVLVLGCVDEGCSVVATLLLEELVLGVVVLLLGCVVDAVLLGSVEELVLLLLGDVLELACVEPEELG